MKEVTVVFENCEILTIAREDIESLYIGDILESLYYDTDDKRIVNIDAAGEVYLVIRKTGNREYFPCGSEGCATTVFNRLSKNDISQIYLTGFGDGNEEGYSVLYDEEEAGVLGSKNRNQKTVLLESSDLSIEIKRTGENGDE